MKHPKSIIISESLNHKTFTIKTFESSLLIFQLTLILTPFLLIELLIVEPDTFLSLTIFILGLLLIIYWIISNILGKYEIHFTQNYIEFKLGFPVITEKIHYSDIIRIRIKRRMGKTGMSGRTGATTTGPNVDDYYIITKSKEFLIIPKCSNHEKAFIKTQIELHIKKSFT
jgi:hypothetical protein